MSAGDAPGAQAAAAAGRWRGHGRQATPPTAPRYRSFVRGSSAFGARRGTRVALESRSNRLPEFVLDSPAQLASTAEKHVDGNPDKRVLRYPLSLSPALAVESPADPR